MLLYFWRRNDFKGETISDLKKLAVIDPLCDENNRPYRFDKERRTYANLLLREAVLKPK